MKIEKEPLSFKFDYSSKNNQQKMSRIQKIVYQFLLTVTIGVSLLLALKMVNNLISPNIEFNYEVKDVVELSYQVNKDIEGEMNNKKMSNFSHSHYNINSLQELKKMVSNFKKENKEIEFLPNEVNVETVFNNAKALYAEYNVTMPYIEKTSVDKNVFTVKKNINYTVEQNMYTLSVIDMEMKD